MRDLRVGAPRGLRKLAVAALAGDGARRRFGDERPARQRRAEEHASGGPQLQSSGDLPAASVAWQRGRMPMTTLFSSDRPTILPSLSNAMLARRAPLLPPSGTTSAAPTAATDTPAGATFTASAFTSNL